MADLFDRESPESLGWKAPEPKPRKSILGGYSGRLSRPRITQDMIGEPIDIEAPAVEDTRDEPFKDAAKQLGAGIVEGVGSTVRGIGEEMVDPMRRAEDVSLVFKLARSLGLVPKPPADTPNPLEGQAARLEGAGKAIGDTVSPPTKAAIEGSTPDGDLTDPSSWTLGADPSLRGYLMQGVRVFGSMAPVVGAAIATKRLGAAGQAAATAGAGGAQGGGAAAKQARDTLAQMSDEQLEAESSRYRELLAERGDPAAARAALSREAEQWAHRMTFPVSAAGGVATGAIIGKPGEKLVERIGSRAGRAAALGGTSAAEEGVQEAAEGMATIAGMNRASGMDQPITEGSFQNFALGAIGGGGIGAVAGAFSASPQQKGAAPAEDEVGDDGTGLPAGERPLPADWEVVDDLPATTQPARGPGPEFSGFDRQLEQGQPLLPSPGEAPGGPGPGGPTAGGGGPGAFIEGPTQAQMAQRAASPDVLADARRQVMPTDVLSRFGTPFMLRSSAEAEAARTGGEVVEVDDGFVVRPEQSDAGSGRDGADVGSAVGAAVPQPASGLPGRVGSDEVPGRGDTGAGVLPATSGLGSGADPTSGNQTAEASGGVRPRGGAPAVAPGPARRTREQAAAARKRAYRDANPFRAFLGEFGVHTSERSDAGGDPRRPVMIPYHGALFRNSGMRLDELAQRAQEAGFLTQADIDSEFDNGGVNKLADMIRRELAGERIMPVADAESTEEARWREQSESYWEAMAEAEAAITALTDDEINALLQIASDEDAEVSNEEIDLALEPGDAQESSAGAQESAPGPEARGDSAGGAEARPDGSREVGFDLTAPTPDQFRREAADAEAQARREGAPPPEDFTLTGSNRTVDQTAARGQMDLAPVPETGNGDEAGAPSAEKPGMVKRAEAALTEKKAEAEQQRAGIGRDGRTEADRADTKLRSNSAELAGQLATEIKEDDFDPAEVRPALEAWAKQANVPADDLRQAVLKRIADTDGLSASHKKRIADALSPTKAAAQAEKQGTLVSRANTALKGKKDAAAIARDIAKERPFDDAMQVRAAAREAIREQLGQKALDEMGTGSMMTSDELTQAVHDGQYEGIAAIGRALPVPVTESQIGAELSDRAFAGTSHSPERRGQSARREYVIRMVEAWLDAKQAAGDDAEALARITDEFEKLRDGYLSRYRAYLGAHSKVQSSMIAGPARFPVERNRKRSEAADKRAADATDFLRKGIERLKKAARAPVDQSPASEVERIRKNLAERERAQEQMKAVNAALRKGDDAALREMGFSDEAIAQFKKPDFAGRTGFPSYRLTNNQAEIRRLRERLEQAEGRVEAAANGPTSEIVNGVRIEEDAQANRIRLIFEGKPDEATRTALKAAGFRWAPSVGAWQRQLTGNARAAARSIVGRLTAGEPQAQYRADGQQGIIAQEGGYETDLFGDPLPQARRSHRRSRPAVAGVHGDVQPAAAIQDTQAPSGDYLARTIVGGEARRTLGAAVIKTASDAARATRYLYRNAVERFDGIVTDKDGKPLAVIGGFKGALTQSAIYPSTLIGEAVRVPGAARVWFSHNHPSGTAELSAADRHLHGALNAVFRGSGVEPMGLLAVAGDKYAYQGVTRDGHPDQESRDLPMSGAIENVEVPVIERMLAPANVTGPAINAPAEARRVGAIYYGRAKEPGLMLLDAQHRVVAWVPLAKPMLGKLRGTGGMRALYRAVSESTAAAVVVVHGGELDALPDISRVPPIENIGAALRAVDVAPLDAINVVANTSRAEAGQSLASGPVFSRSDGNRGAMSRGRGTTGQSVAAVTRIADAVRAAWANGPEVVVVPNMDDPRVPESARREWREQVAGGAAGDVRALYTEAGIFLMADHLTDAGDVVTALAHEALGHYGLRGVFGDRLAAVLEQVARAKPDEVAAKLRQYGLENTAENRLIAAEEVLAVMAQAQPEAGFVKAAVAMIRNWLRRLGLNLRLSDADIIANFILPARRFVEIGSSRRAGGTASEIPMFSLSNAFKRWFAGSKVVDAEGKPLVVYHGTNADFTEFSDAKAKTGQGFNSQVDGFWFSADERIAERFGARVVPVYLAIKNPFRMKAASYMQRFMYDGEDAAKFKERLVKRGYDGIIITAHPEYKSGRGPSGTEEWGFDNFIAFRPEQIKSATGNRGTFDSANPDIRFSHKTDIAAHAAATSPLNDHPEPTEAQKDAGNYPKGHLRVAGLDISIENPAGSHRRPEWPALPAHYGYILGTEGKDGDHVDVFVREGTPEDFDGPVFVIDQNKADGSFDEHKVMLGWRTQVGAARAYRAAFTKGWKGLGAITRATLDDFKAWLAGGRTKQPFARTVDAGQTAGQDAPRGTVGQSHRDAVEALRAALRAEAGGNPSLEHGIDGLRAAQVPDALAAHAARALGRMFGVDVVFVVGDEKLAGRFQFNGIYVGGRRVFVSTTATDPFHQVVGHEFLHHLKRSNPDLYDEFVDAARPYLNARAANAYAVERSDDPNLAGRSEAVRRAGGWEETFADTWGAAWRDPAFWQSLAARERSLFRRIVAKWKAFVLRIRMALAGDRESPKVKSLYSDFDAVRDIIADITARAAESEVGTGEAGLMRSANRNPIFYSELERQIDAINARAQPAKSWLAQINALTTKGVKADEIEWSGIREWLELQDGRVTKEAVLDYLSENGVRVEETMLGAPETSDALLEREARRILREEDGIENPTAEQVAEFIEEHGYDIDNVRDAQRLGAAKFDTYRVPGQAENYRELLLRLPQKVIEPDAAHNARVAEGRKAVFDHYEPLIADIDRRIDAARDAGQRGEYDRLWEQRARLIEERDATAASKAGVMQEPRKEKVKFQSGHWNQPNVLAHARIDERTDADGKRVLFVNEIQSDWAQSGRKNGFRDLSADEIRRKRVLDAKPVAEWSSEDMDWYNARVNDAPRDGAPRAPFVEKTDAWVALALKRIIRYAVDNGFDRVALVNGEQAAKMFDLSQHIKRIYYSKTANGYVLSADGRNGEVFGRTSYAPEELDNVVGKEVADKIRNDEGRDDADSGSKVLEGVDLEVGGEGMEKFYPRSDLGPVGTDKNGKPIYPIAQLVAQKVLKQIGGPALTTVDVYTPARAPGSVNEQGIVIGPDGERSRMAEQPGFDITPAMRERAARGMPMFSRRQATAGTAPVTDPKVGPIDTLLRGAGGKVLSEKLLRPLYDRLIRAARRATPEAVKQGLVSDYGLDEPYMDVRDATRAAINKQLRSAKSIIDMLAGLNREQSRVAYQWMTDRPDAAAERAMMDALPEDSRAVMQRMKEMVHELGRAAVRAGLLSEDAFQRNEYAYLHRSYTKHEAESAGADGVHWKARAKIRAETFKGRGLRHDIDQDRLLRYADEFKAGDKFVRYERRRADGKLAEVRYVPVGKPAPAELADWGTDGVWEARWMGKPTATKVGMWRDFTKAERERMGEIEEVRYAFAKTVLSAARDIEHAKFLQWVAGQYGRDPEGLEAAGETVHDGKAGYINLRTYAPNEWVRVPSTKIPGTGLRAYGALAGKAVPAAIWNDIRSTFGSRPETLPGKVYDWTLRAWKISKTALSPAVHMNNVMANVILADLADIRVTDMVEAFRVLRAAKQGDAAAKALIARYEDSGAEQGSLVAQELRLEAIEPMLADLLQEADHDLGMVKVSQLLSMAAHGDVAAALQGLKSKRAMRTAAIPFKKLIDAYHMEDSVFRLAAFLRHTKDGMSDLKAGQVARDAFLNYDINAPWINALRRGPLPFIAFSYRAIPMLMKAAIDKPWKIAKYAGIASVLNSAAYMMLGLGGDDERRERALLPEEKSGRVFGIFPRLMRMPWNDEHGAPVFLDVRRWLPAGDVFDVQQSQSTVPLPGWLTASGPLGLFMEMMLNKSSFTGNPIVLETDTTGEAMAKVADHLFKFMTPNLPVPNPLGWVSDSSLNVPGLWQTYSWTSISNAGKGVTDAFGRERSVGQAAAAAVGVKLGSYPKDVMLFNSGIEHRQNVDEIRKQVRQIGRQQMRGSITPDEAQQKMDAQREKLRRINERLREKMEAAR